MNKDIFLTNSYGNKKEKFIPINPKKCPNSNTDSSEKFINWITSKEGQELINSFRKNGEQLFFGNSKEN